MSAAIAVGLLLALASAAAINWGYVVQHGAAAALPPLSLRSPARSLATLFRQRTWLLGFAAGVGGWVLYVAALWLAPLSLVQATAAGGIALLALLVGGLTERERAAVALRLAIRDAGFGKCLDSPPSGIPVAGDLGDAVLAQ